MLAGVDKGLMWASWLAAGIAVLLLLIGPKVVAHDSKASVAGTSYAPVAVDGQALFKSNCGSCHTLSKAGTSGAVGPKLDGIGLDAISVEAAMKAGPGVMPEFARTLSEDRIKAVAKFVASVDK